jgi:hypothetical protein
MLVWLRFPGLLVGDRSNGEGGMADTAVSEPAAVDLPGARFVKCVCGVQLTIPSAWRHFRCSLCRELWRWSGSVGAWVPWA